MKELKAKKADELTSVEKSLLESLEALEAAENDLRTSEERNSNAQKKIDEWGGEIGAVRKELKELREKGFQRQEPPNGGDDDKAKADRAAQVKVQADAIQKKLTSSDEGKKLLETAWENLSPEGKVQIGVDDEYRLKVYRAAEALLPNTPNRPWDTSGAEDIGEEDDVTKLFEKTKPDGYRRAPGTRTTPGAGKKPAETRLAEYSEADHVEDDRCK